MSFSEEFIKKLAKKYADAIARETEAAKRSPNSLSRKKIADIAWKFTINSASDTKNIPPDEILELRILIERKVKEIKEMTKKSIQQERKSPLHESSKERSPLNERDRDLDDEAVERYQAHLQNESNKEKMLRDAQRYGIKNPEEYELEETSSGDDLETRKKHEENEKLLWDDHEPILKPKPPKGFLR